MSSQKTPRRPIHPDDDKPTTEQIERLLLNERYKRLDRERREVRRRIKEQKEMDDFHAALREAEIAKLLS